MLNVKIRNNDKLANKLSKLPYGVRGKACEAATLALLGKEGSAPKGLRYYPPKPANSTYVRTFTLRGGWQASKWGDGTKIKIINAVPYAPFVQGNKEQAWMHKGRWRTVSKIISDNRTVIDNAINAEVKKYLKEKGL